MYNKKSNILPKGYIFDNFYKFILFNINKFNNQISNNCQWFNEYPLLVFDNLSNIDIELLFTDYLVDNIIISEALNNEPNIDIIKRNLINVYNKISKVSYLYITKTLINDIHSIIVADLNIKTGFRTSEVRPSFSTTKYSKVLNIDKELNIILTEINFILKNFKNISLSSYILQCVILFRKFLQIHPYNDANGRTAIILLNIMLSRYIKFPISLVAFENNTRLIYLDILEYYEEELPVYILLCIEKTISDLRNLLIDYY